MHHRSRLTHLVAFGPFLALSFACVAPPDAQGNDDRGASTAPSDESSASESSGAADASSESSGASTPTSSSTSTSTSTSGDPAGTGTTSGTTSGDATSSSTSTPTGTDTGLATDDGILEGSDTTEGSSGGSEGGGEGPQPSPGCGQATPPSGPQNDHGNYTISLPANYDPQTPYRLGFAFHGYGRTEQEAQSVDLRGIQSELGGDSILIWAKSVGDGWEQDQWREANVTNFEAILEKLSNEACVDMSRIFVTGHSSGAGFANILGCRFGDRLQAIAPVGGAVIERDCVGSPAAIVVHGVDDNFRNNGEASRDFWADHAGCSQPETDLAQMEARVRAARSARSDDPENVECTSYQGCMPGSTVTWCIHGEDGYDDTTHGWPTNGGAMIRDALDAL